LLLDFRLYPAQLFHVKHYRHKHHFSRIGQIRGQTLMPLS
jgi:hypothetical protein